MNFHVTQLLFEEYIVHSVITTLEDNVYAENLGLIALFLQKLYMVVDKNE